MSVLFEEWQPAAVDAALLQGPYHPRITFHILVEGVIWRFIKDIENYTIDGNEYLRLQYVNFSPVETSEGDAADRVDIILDGSDLKSYDADSDFDPQTAFSNIIEKPLRGAPCQIGLVMLDPLTMEPVGLQSDFVGYFEGAELDAGNMELVGSVLSQETWYHQREPEVYMNISHTQIHPNDECFKHVAETVRRRGNAKWNDQDSGSATVRGGGGGRRRPDLGSIQIY